MKLNIGGGFKRYDGFVNVDYDSLCNPDIICNIEIEKLPIEDNIVTDDRDQGILRQIRKE
jgi:hypothetical protein